MPATYAMGRGTGVTQQDLSGYFAVRAAELYLRPGGKLGMVMPLATLSRMAFAGFRKGDYGAVRSLFEPPWDLEKVRPSPFPVPSAVVFATLLSSSSEKRASMPPNTIVWSGSLRRAAGTTWAGVEPYLTVVAADSRRVDLDDLRLSPYAERFGQGATIVPRVFHVVERMAPADELGLPRGIVHVRSKRSMLEKEPWKSLPDRDTIVEERFVFNAYFGTTILPFRYTSS